MKLRFTQRVVRSAIAATLLASVAMTTAAHVSAADGDSDQSFFAGRVLHEFGGPSTFYDAAVQSDGKIVTTGKVEIAGVDQILVARFNTDGSLDTTFNLTGWRSIPLGSGDSEGNAVLTQSDGSIFVRAMSDYNTVVPDPYRDALIIKLTSSGAFDTTYAVSSVPPSVTPGVKYLSISRSTISGGPSTMAFDSVGRLVVIGTVRDGSDATSSYVARLLSNGEYDSTFDSDGLREFFTPTETSFSSVAITTGDKIVVGGSRRIGVGSETRGIVAKFNTNGTPDLSFDTDGWVDVSSAQAISAIALQADGKIVVAGITVIGGADTSLALRLNSSGSIDTTFSASGTFVSPASDAAFLGIHIDSSGKIVIFGFASTNPEKADLLAIRLSSNGVLDSTFGNSGISRTPVGFSALAFSGTVQGDGRYILVGQTTGSIESYRAVIVRLDSLGKPDATFLSGGFTQQNSLLNGVYGSRILELADGSFITLGGVSIAAPYMYLVKYRSDGTIDRSFGSDFGVGIGTIGLAAGPVGAASYLLNLESQSSGRILVLAQQPISTGSPVVLGFTNAGILDPTFGVSGTAAFTVDNMIPTKMVVLPDNKILVTASTTTAGESRMYRLNANGTIDSSFGTGGSTLIASPDTSAALVSAMNVSADGKIIVVGELASTSDSRTLISRYSANGTLDTTFGTNGFAFVGPGTSGNYAATVNVLPDGRLLISGQSDFGTSHEIFLTRLSSSGTTDTTFGTNGYIRYAGVGSSVYAVVAVQPDQRILIGYATDQVIINRLNENGSIDSTFGTNGSITRRADSGERNIIDLVRLRNGKIMASWVNYPLVGFKTFDIARIQATTRPIVPLTPARLFDTRDGSGSVAVGKVGDGLGGGTPIEFTVTGQGGVPATGVGAVSLNVTAVNTEAPNEGGYVTVYPCGTRPNASNLNFTSNQIIPNAVIAPVSANGKVCFYVYGKAHLLADVNGWLPNGAAFTAVSPARLFDTRDGSGSVAVGKVGDGLGGGTPIEFTVTGQGGVPATGVGAVSLNVTAVNTEAPNEGGYVTVYPCGTRPNASNLNFTSNQIIPNAVIAPVSANGKVCFYVYGKAHLLADVNGWFAESQGANSVTPARLFDTRDGSGGVNASKVGDGLGGGTPIEFTVTGQGGVPATGVGAVSLNVTAVNTEAPNEGGYVTVYPCGTRPNASNLNFTSNQIIPNAVIAPVSANGKVCFYVYGKAHLLADVNGWYPG